MARSFCLGAATAFGILALLPSKKEVASDVPWASIALALLSGWFVFLSGV
jgi:hypothetical protein